MKKLRRKLLIGTVDTYWSQSFEGNKQLLCFESSVMVRVYILVNETWKPFFEGSSNLILAKNYPRKPKARIRLSKMALNFVKIAPTSKSDHPTAAENSQSQRFLGNEECIELLRRADFKLRFCIRRMQMATFTSRKITMTNLISTKPVNYRMTCHWSRSRSSKNSHLIIEKQPLWLA